MHAHVPSLDTPGLVHKEFREQEKKRKRKQKEEKKSERKRKEKKRERKKIDKTERVRVARVPAALHSMSVSSIVFCLVPQRRLRVVIEILIPSIVACHSLATVF